MTGYTVHTGSNEDFSEGWDRIFGNAGGGKARDSKGKSGGTAARPAAAKAAAKGKAKSGKKK